MAAGDDKRDVGVAWAVPVTSMAGGRHQHHCGPSAFDKRPPRLSTPQPICCGQLALWAGALP